MTLRNAFSKLPLATLALALGAALLVAAFPASAQGGPTFERPQYAPGDKWTYRGSTEVQGTPMTIQAIVTTEGFETVDGVAAIKSKMVMTFTFQGQTMTMSSTFWARQSDGARLKGTDTMNGQTSSYTYDPPCTDEQYPVTVGKKWTSSCTKVSSSGERSTETTSYEATGVETVTVPAGTFETLVVEATGNSPGTAYFARQVGGPARMVLQDPNLGEMTLDLQSYTRGTPPQPPTPTPTVTGVASPTPVNTTGGSSGASSKKTPGPELAVVVGGVAALAAVLAVVRRRSG